MKILRAVLVTVALFVASCGDNTNCKDACDKVARCGLKSSGLSCDSNCKEADCAGCVNEKSCTDIEGGKCASACPGVSFTK